MTRILVLFHSVTGHVRALAESVAEGVGQVAGCTADCRRIPEIPGGDAYYGATGRDDDLPAANPAALSAFDGFAFGTPVHFGAPSAAVLTFLARTGKDWMTGGLVGRPATVFTAGGSGGGRETAIMALWAALATHGMTLVPLGNRAPEAANLDLPNGASPFGAGTLSSASGARPSEPERIAAQVQGQALATIARALRGAAD